jgi:hypothetical protein
MSNVVQWMCISFYVVGKGSGDKTGAELDGLVGGQTESAKLGTYWRVWVETWRSSFVWICDKTEIIESGDLGMLLLMSTRCAFWCRLVERSDQLE